MKRSFLLSALVLSLAAMTPACGGGGEGKTPDGEKPGEEPSSGDPVQDLKNISEGLQKSVDEVLSPIKNFDAVLDSIAKIPADLKAAKSKVEPKKLLAEMKKILDGGNPELDALKLEDDAKKMVQERIDKVKALVDSIKNIDEAVKGLGQKIADAVIKIPQVGAKAIAKAEIALKNPLAAAADKDKAKKDAAEIKAIIEGFKTKAEGWQKEITELPGKVKALPEKLAKGFAGVAK
jgi:uncharacterized coiled-coil DUF342 family protein